MSVDNKVVWSEGMFLRAQHFQQEARWVEKLVASRTAPLRAHGWGIVEMQLNRELLATGRFALVRCKAILPDGTPASIPDDDDHPAPLALTEEARDKTVFLTVPVRQPGGVEVSDAAASTARWRPVEADIDDGSEGSTSREPIRVGRLRLAYRLAADDNDLAGFHAIGLARIADIRPDGAAILDESWIPPVLDSAASTAMQAHANEILGLLQSRGDALARRATSGGRGVAEVADFLMLQAVNRYQPVVAYLAQANAVHPETLYQLFLALAGELATFAADGRRPPAFPPYRHEAIAPSFAPILGSLRSSLSAVLEQSAVQIPLDEHKYGIRVGTVADRTLYANSSFVLAVKAAVPADHLMRTFPGQVKIGPVEQIRELVNAALPGVRLRALPVAPRQLPFQTGTAYFELDRTSPLWRQLATSGGLALHVAGEYPELELEFWALKG
jgi:type VI secretion system protein ImpJ